MNKNNFCVIMAGGIGTRFWPMSRISRPKQFIDVLGIGETLIQQTFRRFEKICPRENIFIVTNLMYRNLVHEQIPGLGEYQVLCEPARRNTAPCIAFANQIISNINPDANIIVAPSDQVIINEDRFVEILNSALNVSEQNDWLLTLGIKPTYPNTGYGYIQFNENQVLETNRELRKVITFTEKPCYEMAVKFLKDGDFLWNSGIFIWSLKSITKAFSEHLPEILEVFRPLSSEITEAKIEETYTICPSISIDYGIMEKAQNVYVMVSDFGWSDVGTWASLYEVREKDKNLNTIVGKNVMTYDTKDCIITMPKHKLAVLQGLEDFIVIEEDDILLICKKDQEQQIRKFVSDVEVEKGEKFL